MSSHDRPPIPVFRPWYDEREASAVGAVIESRWVGQGPVVAEFERRFAERVGARHAVAVSSGTAALHLACLCLDLRPGDEVLVPTLTFAATAHAVRYCGAEPVFVDIEPHTLTVDTDDLRRRITPRTRAVIVVHYGGHPCPMDRIWDIADEHGLQVIEDAAHACGSRYRDRWIGGLERSVFTCFSFFATKNLAVGDGGMVTTASAELAFRLRRLRWMGIDRSSWERMGSAAGGDDTPRKDLPDWQYDITDLGLKYQMNDVTAAIGLCQLDKLDRGNALRRRQARRYDRAFAALEFLERPEQDWTASSCHNYVVRTVHRDLLHIHLKWHGIASSVHYVPLHLQPYYHRRDRPPLPVAEALWPRLLTLPLYPELTDDLQDRVIAAVTGLPSAGEQL
jgi:perosamine synthetase